jgi:hypothetical protein
MPILGVPLIETLAPQEGQTASFIGQESFQAGFALAWIGANYTGKIPILP